MPELPEVETVRLQLLHRVVGKKIRAVTVYHQKTVAHDSTITDRLVGKTIAHIDRVGKLLIFTFNNEPELNLLVHLKMTGQFLYVDKEGVVDGGGHTMTDSDVSNLPGRHTRVSFHFVGGATLYFNDMRLFGYTKLATLKDVIKERAKYGPEPITDDFDVAAFTTGLKKRRTIVKAALLDQSFVAGLGNIYVDEALFMAAVSPTRRSNTITRKEAASIAAAAGKVMRDSISMGGTTFRNFVSADGKTGNYMSKLQVFGRQNQPCLRCGGIIKKIRAAGRGTHYCPQCQH
jgi:formamidopyrimidine-DNA glycosylase